MVSAPLTRTFCSSEALSPLTPGPPTVIAPDRLSSVRFRASTVARRSGAEVIRRASPAICVRPSVSAPVSTITGPAEVSVLRAAEPDVSVSPPTVAAPKSTRPVVLSVTWPEAISVEIRSGPPPRPVSVTVGAVRVLTRRSLLLPSTRTAAVSAPVTVTLPNRPIRSPAVAEPSWMFGRATLRPVWWTPRKTMTSSVAEALGAITVPEASTMMSSSPAMPRPWDTRLRPPAPIVTLRAPMPRVEPALRPSAVKSPSAASPASRMVM